MSVLFIGRLIGLAGWNFNGKLRWDHFVLAQVYDLVSMILIVLG